MTGKGQDFFSAHLLLSLFGIWLGIGFLLGITGSVIAAPSYAMPVDRESEMIYASGLQPQTTGGNQNAGTDPAAVATAANKGELFLKKGCTQCHEVSYYGITGGVTGPDLTKAYADAPARFGKTLAEFLKEPEGTMAEMFVRMEITEEEKAEVLKLLTEAGGGAAADAPEAESKEQTGGE